MKEKVFSDVKERISSPNHSVDLNYFDFDESKDFFCYENREPERYKHAISISFEKICNIAHLHQKLCLELDIPPPCTTL